jgi:hypothetical protein
MKTRMQIESGRTRIDARHACHATPRRLTLIAPLFSDMQNLYAGLQRSFLVLPTIRVCREFSGQKKKIVDFVCVEPGRS